MTDRAHAHHTSADLSRRAFIQITALTTLGGLLEACGAPVPSANSTPTAANPPSTASVSTPIQVSAPAAPNAVSTAIPTGAAAATGEAGLNIAPRTAAALPTYIPLKPLSPPDFDAHDPRITVGYNTYPKNPPKSWTRDPPGTGGRVTAFVATYYPPPTPFDQNATWHTVNQALNADFQMDLVAGPDYPAKLATIMAGGDLPDLMHIGYDIGSAPGLSAFFKAKCADLTPYLAGDAVKEYPNLASIPTHSWYNANCAIEGQLFQWPINRYLPASGTYFFKNVEMWNQKVGENVAPRDATDLKKIMQQLNDPNAGVWAIGNNTGGTINLGLSGYAMMFGAPYRWGLDSSGKIIKDWETEPYKAAVGYVRDVWAAGLIWPDAPSSQNSRTNFVGKKFALSVEGFGNSWNDFWLRGLAQQPPAHFDIIMPFGADESTKVQAYNSGGFNATNVMKNASADRIRELLRIVDYLAKPFGTQEDLLLSFGLQGDDYAFDANGEPKPTTAGTSRSAYVPWQYISDRAYVQYYPGIADYAAHVFPIEKSLVDPNIAVRDASLGLYSPTSYQAANKTGQQSFFDGVNDIMLGRRPISDYDGLLKTWQSAVGNQLKSEYNDALAKQNS
jgi:putative aldouronate transport system substrate-binding protein